MYMLFVCPDCAYYEVGATNYGDDGIITSTDMQNKFSLSEAVKFALLAENSVRKNANKAHTKKVANKLISQQFPGRDLDKDVIKYNEFISGHSNTIIYDSLVDNPINIYNQNTTITW